GRGFTGPRVLSGSEGSVRWGEAASNPAERPGGPGVRYAYASLRNATMRNAIVRSGSYMLLHNAARALAVHEQSLPLWRAGARRRLRRSQGGARRAQGGRAGGAGCRTVRAAAVRQILARLARLAGAAEEEGASGLRRSDDHTHPGSPGRQARAVDPRGRRLAAVPSAGAPAGLSGAAGDSDGDRRSDRRIAELQLQRRGWDSRDRGDNRAAARTARPARRRARSTGRARPGRVSGGGRHRRRSPPPDALGLPAPAGGLPHL